MTNDMTAQLCELRDRIMEADFSRMNGRQREAVLTTRGPLLVLAGAGSGKTTVLVNRIVCILKYGNAYHSEYAPLDVTQEDIAYLRGCLKDRRFTEERLTRLLGVDPPPPWSILAITFTNKAANEMKSRLETMLGEQALDIWACTFHSACVRILRRDIDKLGMPYDRNFTIYDTDDTKRLLTECCRDIAGDDRSFVSRTVMPAISKAKEKGQDPRAFEAAAAGDYRLKQLTGAYYKYQQALEKANAMDFDDILRLTVRLFDTAPDVLDHYQRRFRYILVDEYQDTNLIQYKLVSQLAGRHRNLCVVGDDDQSIYSFRGATIENILSFEKQFSGAKVVKLEQNYRSTSVILDAANAVIAHNTGRKGKTLWTENKTGDKIHVNCLEDETDESQFIAATILDDLKKGMTFSQHAVLYRMNAQSASIEKAFVKTGIAYRIIGGFRFYDRQEIKDVLAYLKVLTNPRDDQNFARIVNTPRRGIGDATIAAAQEIAARQGISLYDVFLHYDEYEAFARKAGKIRPFMDMVLGLRALSEKVTVHELIQAVLANSGYMEQLRREDEKDGRDRIENLGTLVSNAVDYEKNEEEPSLAGFLEEASLMSDIDNYDGSADTVTMMTVHSAKGLEFPVVFIAGMEEGIFPGQASLAYPSQLEEERRLAYVAITRAKEELYISYARTRLLFGSTVHYRPSPFVREIPDELREGHDNRLHFTPRPHASASGALAFEGAKAPGFGRSAGHAGAAEPKQAFVPGETVRHSAFGTGMVLSAKPMGGDTLLEIAFDSCGTKKLMANFARLTKV